MQWFNWHKYNTYDFCGEMSKILPNTLSKVAWNHFCRENSKISQIYENNGCKIHRFNKWWIVKILKNTDLVNFWWEIVGKQACSLWGPGNWNL